MRKPVCVVVGVGPGNGAAFARRFASEGYRVALLARGTEFTRELAAKLDGARAYACDITDAASVERTFAAIRTDLGEVEVLVYNSGPGVWANVEDVTVEDFEASWRTNVFGALLASKQVIPAMKKNRRGSIVFIGATASRRGGARTAAFAPAKAAQKSLAESMARHLWPSGIHVALAILDGVVDTPVTRKRMPDKPDSYFIKPDDVADNVFRLTRQKPSAWSFEIEARPSGEVW
ncbi:MAG: SDR family NAD(P)-dependent oxidoreductase [Gammaproteobacteria bacterium]|nr:SDR family NAD(P)-dependent oxidoreductase [Gammaproteobacteria bacterium]